MKGEMTNKHRAQFERLVKSKGYLGYTEDAFREWLSGGMKSDDASWPHNWGTRSEVVFSPGTDIGGSC